MVSLQERFAPDGRCFGCGPANEWGLRIRSFEADDGTVVADFLPRTEHEAFTGYVSGGILGTLVDCHSNWTAIAALMARAGASQAPSTVTSDYSVRFRRPTPSDRPPRIRGRVVQLGDDRATVESAIEVDDIVTTTGRATFVVVGPDHPAYGRWGSRVSRPWQGTFEPLGSRGGDSATRPDGASPLAPTICLLRFRTGHLAGCAEVPMSHRPA